MPKTQTKRKSQKNKTKKTRANLADKYELYQKSVQEPDCEIDFFDLAFGHNFKHKAITLREDFCGTAAVCCSWVKSDKNRVAYGYDLDPEPLAWGTEHNLGQLKKSQLSRVTLNEADVRKLGKPKADILAAQNFSFFYMTTRKDLLAYFKTVYKNLADEGIFVLDMMGGNEVLLEEETDVRHLDGFDYLWEQASFDPITAMQTCHIHFHFPDGSEWNQAFTYTWRLWTIPEVREVLIEAGFDSADVYWEGTDEDGEGDGIFTATEHASNEASWIAYLVGVKRKG